MIFTVSRKEGFLKHYTFCDNQSVWWSHPRCFVGTCFSRLFWKSYPLSQAFTLVKAKQLVRFVSCKTCCLYLYTSRLPIAFFSQVAASKHAVLQEVLSTAKRLAESRLSAICNLLSHENEELHLVTNFLETCRVVLGAVFDSHLDLLFGQHLNNLISCAIYGSARLHNVVLSFRRINAAAMHVSPHIEASTFKNAQLKVRVQQSMWTLSGEVN